MELPEINELRALCEELGEKRLIAEIEAFIRMSEGLESKKGKEFIEVSLLGFAEGILVSLRRKHPEDERISELLMKVSMRRAKLDEMLRKPEIPFLKE